MKLTTKGRYAVMAMADLALYKDKGPISLDRNFYKTKYFFILFRTNIFKTKTRKFSKKR